MQMLLGKKKNMITRFDSRGNSVPVTIISATTNLVVGHRQTERDGYSALQIGFETAKRPKSSMKKGYKDLKFIPKTVREFRFNETLEVPAIGTEITVADFASGDVLKVTGTSRGKGFAGVVKRWGFAGGPRTHGQSDRERAPGSIGMATTPGRVFKGKKMAGHTGNARKTVSGVIVYDIDVENNLILVKGAIPGAPNSLLMLEKVSSKKPLVEPKSTETVSETDKDSVGESVIEVAPDEETPIENTVDTEETIEEVVEVENATQEGSAEGENIDSETPSENSSDSPTPPEADSKEVK